jgi:hypothetical protein
MFWVLASASVKSFLVSLLAQFGAYSPFFPHRLLRIYQGLRSEGQSDSLEPPLRRTLLVFFFYRVL